jgi:Sigma-70, region 4
VDDAYMNDRWWVELEALGDFTQVRPRHDEPDSWAEAEQTIALSVKGAEFRAFWSEFWSNVRRREIEKRAETVADRLQGPPDLPDWLADLLEECHAEFTPRQHEALVYSYGYGLTLQEAANVLGTTKQAFRKRLRGAQAKVEHLTAQVLRLRDALDREATVWIDNDHYAAYVWPLVERQRRLQRRFETLASPNHG